MKFLVPNYNCLQNPWLGGSCPQIPVLCPLSSTEFVEPSPNKIPGYATAQGYIIWKDLRSSNVCTGVYQNNLLLNWMCAPSMLAGQTYCSPEYMRKVRSGQPYCSPESVHTVHQGRLNCSPEFVPKVSSEQMLTSVLRTMCTVMTDLLLTSVHAQGVLLCALLKLQQDVLVEWLPHWHSISPGPVSIPSDRPGFEHQRLR